MTMDDELAEAPLEDLKTVAGANILSHTSLARFHLGGGGGHFSP